MFWIIVVVVGVFVDLADVAAVVVVTAASAAAVVGFVVVVVVSLRFFLL